MDDICPPEEWKAGERNTDIEISRLHCDGHQGDIVGGLGLDTDGLW